MSSGIEGFINTFFQAEALKNQRQQQAMLEQNSQVQRANVLSTMASTMADPDKQKMLSMFLGGDDQMAQMFGEVLQSVAPGQGVLQQLGARAGIERLEEGDREQMEDVAGVGALTGTTRSGLQTEEFLQGIGFGQPTPEELDQLQRMRRAGVAAGTTPGQMAADITFADLPEEEQQAFHRIAGGIQLSEMEKNQIAHWAAQMGLNWADLEQRGAFGTIGFMMQLELAEMQMMAQGAGPEFSPNTLINTMNQAMQMAMDKNLSDQGRVNAAVLYNNAADNLTAMGLWNPAIRLSTDPDDFDKRTRAAGAFMYGTGFAATAGAGAMAGYAAGAAAGAPFGLAGMFGAGLSGAAIGAGVGALRGFAAPGSGGGAEAAVRPEGQLGQFTPGGMQQGMSQQFLEMQRTRQGRRTLQMMQDLGLIQPSGGRE